MSTPYRTSVIDICFNIQNSIHVFDLPDTYPVKLKMEQD
jgi:hypothetical protein